MLLYLFRIRILHHTCMYLLLHINICTVTDELNHKELPTILQFDFRIIYTKMNIANSHTHTHTPTHRERDKETERGKEQATKSRQHLFEQLRARYYTYAVWPKKANKNCIFITNIFHFEFSFVFTLN